MNELIWLDRFTGTRYRCDAAWQASVWRHIVDGLRSALAVGGTTQELANAAARFWHNTYYRQVFPLRFGLGEEEGWLQAPPAFPEANQVDLGLLAERPLRQCLLDKDRLSPILPDAQRGPEGWLLADRLLIKAALFNVSLAQTPDAGSTA
ncbi:MAG: hypothetical protein ACUVR4_12365 [Anaerolineae bacterium]